MDGFHIYYANLPHWRQDKATYFVTWCLHSNQLPLCDEERDVVLGVLKHFNGERYDVLASVIMDDHVHLLVYPYENFALEGLCSS